MQSSSSSVFAMTSPSCSSTSPPADQTDVFSDDSGVDVKSLLVKQPLTSDTSNSRRNKRKSSEPKKRKDVLLMKRFRWDSDEDEDLRPDSGIELEPPPPTPRPAETSPKGESSEPITRQSVIRPPPTRGGGKVSTRGGKGMTKQKRSEANARERSRVHTIGAAFESLRQAVPAYAHNQKLSKLAVLRIASAYILALACMAERDYSQEQNGPSLSECVDQCTRTVQAEGRSRRRTTKE